MQLWNIIKTRIHVRFAEEEAFGEELSNVARVGAIIAFWLASGQTGIVDEL